MSRARVLVPVAAQASVAETRVPAVVTQAPVAETRVPVVGIQAPAAETQARAAAVPVDYRLRQALPSRRYHCRNSPQGRRLEPAMLKC